MRLRPHGTDSGALSRSRNRLVNPLDAPPHPQKSFYLTPRSTPMQYQVIILAYRYLLASFGRGAAARPRWFRTELVARPSSLLGSCDPRPDPPLLSLWCSSLPPKAAPPVTISPRLLLPVAWDSMDGDRVAFGRKAALRKVHQH